MGDVVKFTPKQFTKPDLDFVAETAPKYLAFAGRLEAISDDIAEATAMIEEGATWLPIFLETVQSYMAMLKGGQKFLDAEAEGNFANLQRLLEIGEWNQEAWRSGDAAMTAMTRFAEIVPKFVAATEAAGF